MSIVERLAGSPYANPRVRSGGPDASARKTLDLALGMAETMFRYGAGALEVETAMIAVTAAYGLENIEVDITNQSVLLNYSPKDQTPITVMRVVRSWTNNYAGLALVHRLVTDIVDGNVSRAEASQQLNAIVHQPKPFPRWAVTASAGLFAAAIVAFIGGESAGFRRWIRQHHPGQPAPAGAGPLARSGLLHHGRQRLPGDGPGHAVLVAGRH